MTKKRDLPEVPPINVFFDGCTAEEISNVCEYELSVYRNDIGFDDMSEYDRGFFDALVWIMDLINPGVDHGQARYKA